MHWILSIAPLAKCRVSYHSSHFHQSGSSLLTLTQFFFLFVLIHTHEEGWRYIHLLITFVTTRRKFQMYFWLAWNSEWIQPCPSVFVVHVADTLPVTKLKISTWSLVQILDEKWGKLARGHEPTLERKLISVFLNKTFMDFCSLHITHVLHKNFYYLCAKMEENRPRPSNVI